MTVEAVASSLLRPMISEYLSFNVSHSFYWPLLHSCVDVFNIYRIVFKFKNSKKSNNGTDVNAGQIPQLLYRYVCVIFDCSSKHYNLLISFSGQLLVIVLVCQLMIHVLAIVNKT